MPDYQIRVTRGGEPVVGATVVAGDKVDAVTDRDGMATDETSVSDRSVVVHVIVEGEGFVLGSGPHRLRPGVPLQIEV
jgi:hypothetical protein